MQYIHTYENEKVRKMIKITVLNQLTMVGECSLHEWLYILKVLASKLKNRQTNHSEYLLFLALSLVYAILHTGLQYCREALLHCETDLTARLALSEALLASGEQEESLEECSTVLGADPQHREAGMVCLAQSMW